MAISKVKVAGAWVTKPLQVKVAGAWVAKPTYVRVAGAWVLCAANHTTSCPNLSATVANGTYNTTMTVAVSNGVGPFTFLWSKNSGMTGITLSNTTTATVGISSTGTNILREGVIQCVVTDTGNGSYAVTEFSDVYIQHGTPV